MTVVEIIPVEGHLEEVLTAWERRITSIAKAYGAIAADFHMIEARRFNDEGPGWAPLAGPTVAQREHLGYGGEHPILVRTDRLALSLTRPEGVEDGDSVFRVEPDGFFVGSAVPYAHWHQTGGTPEDRPPRRQLVEITEPDKVRWMAILGRYLAHGELDVIVTSPAGPR